MARISQCLIVKNEAKTIQRCLESFRGIAYEQIVVDTGSEDNTVELAEAMGAKLYHFEWINDFAAARNFGISKAHGEWILIMDADEYVVRKEAEKLERFLTEIEQLKCAPEKRPSMLLHNIANITEEGRILTIAKTARVFRRGRMKYVGAIHESLQPIKSIARYDASDVFTLYHTGYDLNIIRENNKYERNISMLVEKLKEDPDNPNTKCYLGDSTYSYARSIEKDPEQRDLYIAKMRETQEWYDAAALNPQGLNQQLLARTFSWRIMMRFLNGAPMDEILQAYDDAIAIDEEFPDFEGVLGNAYFRAQDWRPALEYYERCIQKLNSYKGTAESGMAGSIESIYHKVFFCASALRDSAAYARNAPVWLRVHKDDLDILCTWLQTLFTSEEDLSVESIVELLLKIYDPDQTRDRLILFKAAKMLGNKAFEDRVIELFPENERAQLNF